MNYGLSLIKVDPRTGDVAWAFNAIPYPLDDDPDWAAGAAVVFASCGEFIVSVQKDGWSYAVNAAGGTCAVPSPGNGTGWQFPPSGNPKCEFPSTQTSVIHGDTDYKQPAAVWGDVVVIKTGGKSRIQDNVPAGYSRLHALDVCADDAHRVRWIADIFMPNPRTGVSPATSPTSPNGGYSLGIPTITRGIIYVTTDLGHVLALADPSVWPPQGYRCTSNEFGLPDPQWQTTCLKAGYAIVPVPTVLADEPLPDGGNAAQLRNEPALAYDRVFVGTGGGIGGGHVYALGPRYSPRVPTPLPTPPFPGG